MHPHNAQVIRGPHFTSRDVQAPAFEVVLRAHDGWGRHRGLADHVSADDDRLAERHAARDPARLRCNGVPGAGHLELSTLDQRIPGGLSGCVATGTNDSVSC